MRISRRSFLRGSLLVAGGAAVGAGAVAAPRLFPPKHLPFEGGYAAAADRTDFEKHGQLKATWYVETSEPVVAFTFDDGPGPQWTSMVLDALDEYRVSATFFMVGQNLAAHADLVKGRLDRHDVGNHSWSHPDLAMLDANAVSDQIGRAHDTIQRLTGREAHLLRPPYGHVGGSTMLAADRHGYELVLWSRQMHEAQYVHHEQGQVTEIVDGVSPGQIVLAHDVGPDDRLVALKHLGEMFTGLRRRGFRFVTVSELLALRKPG
ncbi:MAG: polysaccharide deacetylase [Actinobacteria bacterium 13_2_20CM_2_71_6]|nr:MAG: polysaccharide deacetylase [Actinobacteria bacterium 13_2_20CM_2_71_6]